MVGRAPTMAFLLAQLRRARGAANLSQEDLGRLINFSSSQVSAIETGQRTVTSDFLSRVDAAPDTDGLFVGMLEMIHLNAARAWSVASTRRHSVASCNPCSNYLGDASPRGFLDKYWLGRKTSPDDRNDEFGAGRRPEVSVRSVRPVLAWSACPNQHDSPA